MVYELLCGGFLSSYGKVTVFYNKVEARIRVIEFKCQLNQLNSRLEGKFSPDYTSRTRTLSVVALPTH